jgi:hypothetical protein
MKHEASSSCDERQAATTGKEVEEERPRHALGEKYK